MSQATTSSNALARRSDSVSRRDPWTEFDQVRRGMDSMFSRVFGLTPLSELVPSNYGTSYDPEFSPDIYETAEELIFVAPLPGIRPDELGIEATADTLTVKGERKSTYQNENAKLLRQSWWSTQKGTFQASYSLPIEIDPNRIQANFRNGVLELHLPKAEQAKPKAVKVNVLSE